MGEDQAKSGQKPGFPPFLKKIMGPWQDPPTVLIAGPSGCGKTIALLKAFAGAVVLQLPGASRGWNRVLGLPPSLLRTMEVQNIRDARQKVHSLRARNNAILAGKREGDIIWCVLPDDITLLAQAEMRLLRKEIPRADNFWFFEQLKSGIHGFAYDCRMAGMVLASTAHLKRPDDKGPGGPEMPIQGLVAAVPHIFDTSLIALSEDATRRPWPTTLHNYPPGGLYYTKDRHHVVRECSPMNLRELLNHTGYQLPRHPGLEWQDKAAEEVAGLLHAAHSDGKDVVQAFADIWTARMSQLRAASKPANTVLHWRWALEDGRDRYEIRQAETEALFAI